MGKKNKSIVLTGPIGVGKSTQAKLLSKKLNLPVCDYDKIKGKYRRDIGLNEKKAQSIEHEKGVYALLQYINDFKSKILQQIINDHPNHIIDLGGGAHSFDEKNQIERAKKAFESVKDIILLIPSPDLETNINALPGIKENWEINTYLIMHPTNKLFATKTAYTFEKTPEEVLSEILKVL